DESKTLGVVEPLHGATCHGTAPYFRARGRPTYRPTRRLRSGRGDRWTRTMRSTFEVPAWRGSPRHPFEARRPSRRKTILAPRPERKSLVAGGRVSPRLSSPARWVRAANLVAERGVKILVLGGGAQGRVIATDLARAMPTASITVADLREPALAASPNL